MSNLEPSKLHTELEQKRLTALIIWAALTGSMLLYAIVSWGVPQPNAGAGNLLDSRILTAFTVLGTALMVLSGVLRKVLLSPRYLYRPLQGSLPDPLSADAVDQAVLTISDRWLTAHIICWALNEALVISGFVPAFIGRNPLFMLPFLGLGMGLNLWMRPQFKELREKLIEAARQKTD